MKKNRKITILGAGSVGASIAYTFTLAGTCSEIVLIDINQRKAEGEAMDIRQGTSFSNSVDIYAGSAEDAKDSDIVVVTLGAARKPGQSRIDLAQGNVNILKSAIPPIYKAAPDAIYIVVSNPVDILTYAMIKSIGIPAGQVIGSGTLLDTCRLRSIIATRVGLTPQNVHAYVLGEHGDSSMIPWSHITIAGIPLDAYCDSEEGGCPASRDAEHQKIESEVRNSGGKVIELKGATYYAIAMSVHQLCESIIRNNRSIYTVSNLITGQYGINGVCFSLPFVLDAGGIQHSLEQALTGEEEKQLLHSAGLLKDIIATLSF